MVFTGSVFLYLFLPLFLAVYYLLPARARLAWILLASWAFYGWWRLDFLGLIAGVTAWTYLLGRWIDRRRGPGAGEAGALPARVPARAARLPLALGVALDLAVLAYFKYFHFGVRSLNALLAALGARTLTAWEVVLPVGVSFYVFHSISYLVDVHRGDVPASDRPLELAAYLMMFPQLLSGPIIRYKDLAPQLRQRVHSFAVFSEGAGRFMAGFCKKVLIADLVAPIANAAFALGSPTAADAWLGALAYTVQIYFDFSGYSDMAIGLGRMMGFRFPENFRSPYLSRSITEFWRRWHISLSTWLRDYLYFSLGGNRRGAGRTLLNLMLVMVLGGLWHGAAWTFILWGAWQGLFLVLERLRRRASGEAVRPEGARPWAVAATLLVVLVGWVLFRSPTPAAALRLYAGMLGLRGLGLSAALRWQLGGLELAVLGFAWLGVYIGPWLQARLARRGPAAVEAPWDPSLAGRIALLPLFVLALLRTAAVSFAPFLYFQF